MKKNIVSIILLCLAQATASSAQQPHHITIKEFNQAGPFAVASPLAADSVDHHGKKFDQKRLMQAVSFATPADKVFSGHIIPSLNNRQSVGILSFYINNESYLKGNITVKGLKQYELYIDEKKSEKGELALQPEHHTVAIKYLADADANDSVQVTLASNIAVAPTLQQQHPFMFHDFTDGNRVRNGSISADGRYVLVNLQNTDRNGTSTWKQQIVDAQTGHLIKEMPYMPDMEWMPRSGQLCQDVKEGGKHNLYRIDPLTGTRTLMAANIPEGSYAISPTEDFIIIYQTEDGPKKDKEVFEIIEPDDRQQEWRKRGQLLHFDLKTGVTRQLTFGNQSAYLQDISNDGKKLLVSSSRSRLTKRPTSVSNFYIIDLQTLQADTVISDGEFLRKAIFSPDASQILLSGSAESFNRIGCTLPPNIIPNSFDIQLFLYDLNSKKATPLTRQFNPSVNDFYWNTADGMIYFNADDRDFVHLYQLNPKTKQIKQLKHSGENVSRFSLSCTPVMAYLSRETTAPASLYVMNLKKNTNTCIFDGHSTLTDVLLGECRDWNFTNSRGDTVYGRYYLPHDFEPKKQYPMIVYYYGGCLPVSRTFESPYSPQYWNSLGYVAYILQPSGAAGFGQEWAARHVNTWGRGPAEDIIEGTRKFCREHAFVDSTKVGCMGASYGGFMTQYLQTQTHLFAAAVSHAGISNITSYWGEGYWGYSYNETASAGNYPWTNPELYTQQSPLFNADKIKTPLLLLHGTADTNVPVIESIQMFTALKLLGKPTAFVEVEGENHHILNYAKKHKWVATQMAWFQKWLKGDSTWWDALYPAKDL